MTVQADSMPIEDSGSKSPAALLRALVGIEALPAQRPEEVMCAHGVADLLWEFVEKSKSVDRETGNRLAACDYCNDSVLRIVPLRRC